jgi:hypothetical protein
MANAFNMSFFLMFYYSSWFSLPKGSSTLKIRSELQETLNAKYSDYTKIYTHGSKMEERVGCAIQNCCIAKLTVDHLLWDCPSFQRQRKKCRIFSGKFVVRSNDGHIVWKMYTNLIYWFSIVYHCCHLWLPSI